MMDTFIQCQSQRNINTRTMNLILNEFINCCFFVPLDIFAINFSELIRNYVSAFGRNNIYMYFYENFADDPKRQIRKIIEFIGVDYLSQNCPDVKTRVNQSFPPLYSVVPSLFYNFGNIYFQSHLMEWKEVKQGRI